MKQCNLFLLSLVGLIMILLISPSGLFANEYSGQNINGQVANWKFNEGSGTTAYDSSGNSNTGSLVNGPTWRDSSINEYFNHLEDQGTEIYFDGGNSYVQVTDASSLRVTNAITLEAWVNWEFQNSISGTKENPGRSCNHILENYPGTPTSGKYWIDPDGTSQGASCNGYTDRDLTKPVEIMATTHYSTSYPPEIIIDDTPTDNYYHSASGGGNPGNFIQFDLAAPKVVNKLRYKPYDSHSPRQVKLIGSNNKETWAELTGVLNIPDGTGHAWQEFSFVNAIAYRYYRIVSMQTSANTYWVIWQAELIDTSTNVDVTTPLAVATSSTVYNSSYTASLFLDDNEGNYYHSGSNGADIGNWVKIDMIVPTIIDTVRYKPYDPYYPRQMVIQGSNNDSTWVNLSDSITMPSSTGGIWLDYSINNNVAYRYYRLLSQQNSPAGWWLIYEMELRYSANRCDQPAFEVYCDMTSAGGGWTMVGNYRYPASTNGPDDLNYRDYEYFMRARQNTYFGLSQYLATPNSAGPWTDWRVLEGLSWPIEYVLLVDYTFAPGWDSYGKKVIYRVKDRTIMPNWGTSQDLTTSDNLWYRLNPTASWIDVGSSSASGIYYWYPYTSGNGYLTLFHTSNYYYGVSSGETNYTYSNLCGSGIPGGNDNWYHGSHQLIREGYLNGITSNVISKGSAYALGVRGQTVYGMINNTNITASIDTRGWNHVVLTYDKDAGANNLKIYINGILKAQSTLTGAIPAATDNLLLGSRFRGELDEIAIYNSASSQSEIKDRYRRFSRGLVGRWNFDDGAGVGVADSSNFVDHGTLQNGPLWVNSDISTEFETWDNTGYALSLDGSNDSVIFSTNSFADITSYSIELWAKPMAVKSGVQLWEGNSLSAPSIEGDLPNGLSYWVGNSSAIPLGPLEIGKWYQIIATYDKASNLQSLYINGVLMGTRTVNVSDTIGSNFYLGSRGGAGRFFPGVIDQLVIYDRALEYWEIREKVVKYTWGLIGRWDFDEGSGTVLRDGTINRQNGNLIDGTWATSTLGPMEAGAPTGSMLRFDGSNDYVNIGQPIPPILQPEEGLTLEAWIKPAAYSNSNGGGLGGIVASQWDADVACYSMSLDYRGSPNPHGGVLGGIHFQIGDGSSFWATSSSGTTTTAVPLNVWTHVMAVAEPGYEYKVYFDGKLVGNWTARNQIAYSDNCRMAIGWNEFQNGSTRFFNGEIDSVRIYDRPFYSQEVFFKAGLIRESGFPLAIIGNPAHDGNFKVGTPITFASSSTDLYGTNPGLATYFWDFGDGSPILRRDSSVVLSYTSTGDKKIRLWVLDNDGNPSILTPTLSEIIIHINPNATLTNRIDNLKKKR